VGPVGQQHAIVEWREEVKRRAVHDRASRKRRILRERGGVQERIAEEDAPPAMAMAAEGTFNLAAWKPWLRKVCKLCDLLIPEMPLLKHHIAEHMQQPKRRRCLGIAVLHVRRSRTKSDAAQNPSSIAERMGPTPRYQYMAGRRGRGVGRS
jgi:hypothetical protein